MPLKEFTKLLVADMISTLNAKTKKKETKKGKR
jgi:hypothetical protein